ncbi:hypothetical protein [Streptomyces sp. NPDC058683]|uniref:hypothetical protein n=1 Tax=Streptomyces sp. NPDC058683 TaxID=3346597 RepID=UPI0036694FF9
MESPHSTTGKGESTIAAYDLNATLTAAPGRGDRLPTGLDRPAGRAEPGCGTARGDGPAGR